MSILLPTLIVLVFTLILFYLNRKSFKKFLKDENNNNVPDEIESASEKIVEVATKIKHRAERVASEANDVANAASEVIKQSKDVVKVATSSKVPARRGRKPKK